MRKLLLVLTAYVAWTQTVLGAQVDLNSSSRTHLESITGIGPGKARAIVEYRTKHGPFKTVDELDNVPGFGPKSIEKIRSQITVRPVAAEVPANVNTVDSAGNWKGIIR